MESMKLPESPRVPMEFLSRSWSTPSPIELSKTTTTDQFEIQQRVLDRILMSRSQIQLQDMSCFVSPVASGRPSLSNEPSYLSNIIGNVPGIGVCNGESCGSHTATDTSPISPISPSQDFYDVVKFLRLNNIQPQPQLNGGRSTTTTTNGGGKTVGRWLKDRREKKKEETRAHTAQLHAAISVAGVAAAVAAIAAASSGEGEKMKTNTAVASAATLVAAQCVEAAEAMGAERQHLAAVIRSAVNVRSYDDVVTLTAAAATALRGAATLKARALKDVWITPTETPVTKQPRTAKTPSNCYCNSYDEDLNGYNEDFLARGCEILKRTRKGDLHWKIVSVYHHRSGQVMLKMKSRHVAGTITKKKKNVVLEVYKDMPAWPERHFPEGLEQHYYFGLKTENRGIVEFECRNQKEHDLWTQGVLNLLAKVAEKRHSRRS